MLYVDSSAFAKRYLPDDIDHDRCIEHMAGHRTWGTSRLTWLETIRALRSSARAVDLQLVADVFQEELANCSLVNIDQVTLAMARDVVEATDARSLDAIHIASALRVADDDLRFLTFDRGQATAAERMGLRLAISSEESRG